MKSKPNPVNMKYITRQTWNSFSSGVQKGLGRLHTDGMRSATHTKFMSIDSKMMRCMLNPVGMNPIRERAYMVISPTNVFTKSNVHKKHLIVSTSLTLTPRSIALTPNGNKPRYRM